MNIKIYTCKHEIYKWIVLPMPIICIEGLSSNSYISASRCLIGVAGVAKRRMGGFATEVERLTTCLVFRGVEVMRTSRCLIGVAGVAKRRMGGFATEVERLTTCFMFRGVEVMRMSNRPATGLTVRLSLLAHSSGDALAHAVAH